MRPYFTVLVPTYNQDEYLGAALDSLLAQTHEDWEAIVVNDGSTDRSADIIAEYCRKDIRIQGINKANGGAASALNAGLRRARGGWICWLSSDDLFDADKLAVHREWIARCPNTKFFFTEAKQFYQETGDLHHPRLGIPRQAQWQVLEMLRRNYVDGISICIETNALRTVGEFDERLRNAQDHDMWLRLVSLYPAVTIPDRTCVRRCHASQDTQRFPRAAGYDSAVATLDFINEHSFPQFVPLIDLTDRKSAVRAVERALDVAADASGLMYRLGPHPALLLRILEWVSSIRDDDTAKLMGKMIRRRAADMASQYAGTAFAAYWKALAIPHERLHDVRYEPISPIEIAKDYYYALRSGKNVESEQLARYLVRFACCPSNGECGSNGAGEDVVLVCPGKPISSSILTGLEGEQIPRLVRTLRQSGRTVVIACALPGSYAILDGFLCVGINRATSLATALKSLGPAHALIANSSTHSIRSTRALHCFGGQSAQTFCWDLSAGEVNRMGVHLVCSSDEGRTAAIAAGVHPRLIHVGGIDSVGSILDTLPVSRSVKCAISLYWLRVRRPRGLARRIIMGNLARRLISLFWAAVGTPLKAWPNTVKRKAITLYRTRAASAGRGN